MKLVYCYITSATDGSKVHVDSFKKAFMALGESLIDAGLVTPEFTENKADWSMARKIRAKLIWLRLNIKILFHVLQTARQASADVLLFRFMPNHQLFFPIILLSFFYPVILELNALYSLDSPNKSRSLINVLDYFTLRRVSKTFVVSRVLRDYLIDRFRLNPNRVMVIENGVDIDWFTPSLPAKELRTQLDLDGRFVLGFVGSFKPWHGIGTLISLAERLVTRIPEVTFLIVGDGKERTTFESLIRAKGLSGHFVLTGFVPHERVREYLALMDVAVAPYSQSHYQDTFFFNSPLKIFEYMAMAKPIIAPPMGQIADILVDGVSGCLIQAEDLPAMLDAILRMYEDRPYRLQLGHNGRKQVEIHFTWKANAEKVRALCYEILNDYACK